MAAASSERVVIVGGGVGGLAAAVALAARGADVTLLERQQRPGGKLREVDVGGRAIDGGPTVFTMRWVFEELFQGAGLDFAAKLDLQPAELLARHAWGESERLDLFADLQRSADAIGAFSGAEEAKRFTAFAARSAEVFRTLKDPFLTNSRPNPISLTTRVGLDRLGDLWRLEPFSTLAASLARQFRDPRLVQLYGRYATYCGSSPYLAPATLMLVAHVEQDGVWYIRGGMYRLIETLQQAAVRFGARIITGTEVTRIVADRTGVQAVETAAGERHAADAVIVNGDAQAVAAGLFGADVQPAVRRHGAAERSLSALAWTVAGRAEGFPLARHNVFFSRDYRGEFDRIVRERRLPHDPTVYVCAQDRADDAVEGADEERFLILVNAPADGDHGRPDAEEIAACERATHAQLERSGLKLTSRAAVLTAPADFHRLFPATGGALYGRASHGWMASFLRPDGRTRVPGLYLAGGSVHPGPGVPMAALSGQLAAAAILSDFASTRSSHPVAMSGGMSTA